MSKNALILLSFLVVSACAKQPDQIAAIEVGGDAYSRYSCPQLRGEQLTVAQEIENLSASQRSAANGDALGVFLLGIPLSSMSGNDQEASLAIAKGKAQAIQRQLAAKSCG
ncbi:MAG: hypothetical protein K0B16_11340 [Burkholderiaceae bacterium]|nr:hypothetical protein [Burkholderiaceae bacterium]